MIWIKNIKPKKKAKGKYIENIEYISNIRIFNIITINKNNTEIAPI